MGTGIVLKDDVLRRGLSSLIAAKGDFDQVQDRANDAATACGHAGLSSVLKSSSSDWALRRGKLAEALEALAGHMKAAIDGFEHWDTDASKALTPDQAQSGQPAPASSAEPLTASEQPGAVNANESTTATTGAETASTSPPPSPSGLSGGNQEDIAQETTAQTQVGTTTTPDAVRADSTPDTPITSGVSVPITSDASSSTRLTDANLEQLLKVLAERWTSLGGTEKALVAALVGTGLVGVASAISTSTSGPSTDRDVTTVASTQDGGGGSGTSGRTETLAQDFSAAGTSEGSGSSGAGLLEPAAEEDESLAEEPPAIGTQTRESTGDDEVASSAADMAAAAMQDSPSLPAPLPGLSLGSGGDQSNAPSDSVLPSLETLSTASPAVPEAPPELPLPSLSSEPAPATLAAAAVPLSATLLHTSGGTTAAPVSGPVAGMTGLPTLGAPAGAGPSAPSGPLLRAPRHGARDPRRILRDLSEAGSEDGGQ